MAITVRYGLDRAPSCARIGWHAACCAELRLVQMDCSPSRSNLMKKPYMFLLAGMVLGLAGCAGTADRQELSQKTVEYGCGPGGEQPLTVQYTFRGEEAVSARLIYMTQA